MVLRFCVWINSRIRVSKQGVTNSILMPILAAAYIISTVTSNRPGELNKDIQLVKKFWLFLPLFPTVPLTWCHLFGIFMYPSAYTDRNCISHIYIYLTKLGFKQTPLCSKKCFSCDQATLWIVQSIRLSVCLSVCNTIFHYVPIIVSSWNFQELLPMTEVKSLQKIRVRAQRSRSKSWKLNLAISGP